MNPQKVGAGDTAILSKRARGLLVVCGTLAAIIAGCAVNPVTGKNELHLVSEKDEIAMGRKNYIPGQQQSGGQYIIEPELTAYVREVGNKLTRVSDRNQLPYEFVVLNESVPNAWAMPGGKLAVNRGLLTELKSEAELAAVIGHEIVHAAGRHAARGMENNMVLSAGAAVLSAANSNSKYGAIVDTVAGMGAGLLGVKYGRDLELEADHYGMIYMQRAGYDPRAAIGLQETFLRLSKGKSPNWLEGLFASHPPSQERVDANRKLAATMPAGLKVGEAEYQAKIATLLKTRDAYKSFDEGEKALAKKDGTKALQLAEAALKLEPREALFYGLRGDARTLLNQPKEAEADYSEAIKRNPDFYEFYLGRGQLRKKRGETEQAMADFSKANSLLPTAQGHLAMGQMRQTRGERDQAVEHFRLAAQSGDETGKSAGTALARLDLSANPARYISSGIERGQGDQLLLVVKNSSGVRAGRITVTVSHSTRGRENVRIDSLKPGESARVTLPFTAASLKDGSRIGSQVVAAAVVE
jgi:predicted Zn-dependent protease